MSVLVICSIMLLTEVGYYVPVQAKGILVDDKAELWVVDFSEYINKHRPYKKYNNLVQEINNNECLYVK